jgi:hypothetical protein
VDCFEGYHQYLVILFIFGLAASEDSSELVLCADVLPAFFSLSQDELRDFAPQSSDASD